MLGFRKANWSCVGFWAEQKKQILRNSFNVRVAFQTKICFTISTQDTLISKGEFFGRTRRKKTPTQIFAKLHVDSEIICPNAKVCSQSIEFCQYFFFHWIFFFLAPNEPFRLTKRGESNNNRKINKKSLKSMMLSDCRTATSAEHECMMVFMSKRNDPIKMKKKKKSTQKTKLISTG